VAAPTPAPAVAAPGTPAADATAVAVDPLRPDVRLDLNDRSARVDLWERVRNGFAMADLDSELVRERERWYASRPDYVQRMTERGSRYLFHIVEELDRRGMPTELALLPFIESAYNPQAMSTAKASGMWQFIPSTGRDFLLRQNIFRDDRRDVLASTRAALDYLQKLHGMFGDWQLALAAYNWGEGSVQRAINKNKRDGLPTDYSSLRMPAETAQYVQHRLEVAGLSRPLPFERRALQRVHEMSRGVPRRINLLCDRALLGAFASILWQSFVRARLVLLSLLCLAGVAIVAGNWHYVSDIIAGAVLGLTVGAAVGRFRRPINSPQ